SEAGRPTRAAPAGPAGVCGAVGGDGRRGPGLPGGPRRACGVGAGHAVPHTGGAAGVHGARAASAAPPAVGGTWGQGGTPRPVPHARPTPATAPGGRPGRDRNGTAEEQKGTLWTGGKP